MKLKHLFLLAAPLIMTSCGADPYAKINTALNQTYSEFKVQVVTSKDSLQLTSTYTYSKNGDNYTVSYQEESYQELSMDVTGGQKKTTTGTKTVAVSTVSFKKYNVSTNTYTDIEYNETGSFSAKLANAKEFLGVDGNVANSLVNVSFGDKINSISLSYATNGHDYLTTYSNFVL